jgi:hypothetical protein
MDVNTWIVIGLVFLAGCVNGLKDRSALGLLWSPWWNKLTGWQNKWKYTNEFPIKRMFYDKAPWWYLGLFKPYAVERFPYSSTLLVFITDGWHLLQFLQFKLLFAAIILYDFQGYEIGMYLLISTIFSLGFMITYYQDKWLRRN